MPRRRSRSPGKLEMSSLGLSPDQLELQRRARELASGPIARRAAEVDRTEQYPWDNVELLKDAKLIGMTIPPQYGGQGKGWLDAVLAIEALSAACAVTGRIAVETNMGAISAVMAYGSEDQKKMAADMVLSGDKPAICITEPDAGSDTTSMTTRADRKGNRYVINGRKHWITGGGVSRLHLIFAKVYDEKGAFEGIGGFLAIRDETKGLKIAKREPTMGLRGIPEAVIDCEDVDLPPSALVVPPRGLKKGFADLMNAYNSQRVGAATVALGIAEGAYQLALDWSEKRMQFGRPINEFQGLQWKLADMSIKLAAARALVYNAARSGEDGFPDMLLAAQAKIFTSESAIQVVNDALQLFGARGYSRELPLERMARDVRMFTILLARIVVDEADRRVAERRVAQHLPQDQLRRVARADDQHLLAARDDRACGRPLDERTGEEPHAHDEREQQEQVDDPDAARHRRRVEVEQGEDEVGRDHRDRDAAEDSPHVLRRDVAPPAVVEAEGDEDREHDPDDEHDDVPLEVAVVVHGPRVALEADVPGEHPRGRDQRRVDGDLPQAMSVDRRAHG